MGTYLYIYESADGREVYIGIANSMQRVWQSHNPDAEELRDRPGTRILQTVKPFSTRESARTAEAIAIYLARRGGRTVHYIDDTHDSEGLGHSEVAEEGLIVTNRAGTKTTKVLGPAIYHRGGETVKYTDLRNTAIVRITPDPIDYRPAPLGGLPGAEFAERAEKWWGLASAHRERRPVRRLLAVLSGQLIVLGSWELREPWFMEDEGGWRFVLADQAHDNALDLKGRTLTLDVPYPFQTLGYSQDLR